MTLENHDEEKLVQLYRDFIRTKVALEESLRVCRNVKCQVMDMFSLHNVLGVRVKRLK